MSLGGQRNPNSARSLPEERNGKHIRIEHNNNRNNPSSRYGLAPVVDDHIARSNLKRHHGGLEHKKVPPGGKPKRLIDIAAGKADERRGDGQVGHHLGHAQRHGQDKGAPTQGCQ